MKKLMLVIALVSATATASAISRQEWAERINTGAGLCRIALSQSDGWSQADHNKIASAIAEYRNACKKKGQGDTPETKAACGQLHFWCAKWYR